MSETPQITTTQNYYSGKEFRLNFPLQLKFDLIKLYQITFKEDPYNEEYSLQEAWQTLTSDARKKESLIYLEKDESERPVLFVSFFVTNLRNLIEEVYEDDPNLKSFFDEILDNDFVYLSEIFADKLVRPKGNLAELKSILTKASEQFTCKTFFLSTQTPAVVNKFRSLALQNNWEIKIFEPSETNYGGYSFITLNINNNL